MRFRLGDIPEGIYSIVKMPGAVAARRPASEVPKPNGNR